MELTINIPSGVEVSFEGNTISVKGPKGEISRQFRSSAMKIKQGEGKLKITSTDKRKRNTSISGTLASHLENMINGVTKGYEAKMKIVYSHFPIKLSLEGETVIISNFLGERGVRKAKIMKGSTVKLEKEGLLVTGIDKESVGQTAANIELASRVKNRDRRVFQDGCYIIQKPEPVQSDKTPEKKKK